MPKFIENNPFRVVGVFSNATLKEITANKTRIAAYAKVGKSSSFPLDGAGQLPDVVRTPEVITYADHELAMPSSKIIHALFWFVKETSIDEIAISHYINGDIDKAKELLSKRVSASSLVNLSVIGLIEGNYAASLHNTYSLVSNSEMCASFVETICGDTFSIEPFELWKMYIDILLKEKKASVLLRAMPAECSGLERDYIKDKAVEDPIKTLQTEINKACEVTKNSESQACYSAGLRLMESAKKHLVSIKNLIGVRDIRYVNIADAAATQILQCGINYYNATDDDDDVDKAMVLQEYACSVAVGSLVAQRCKKNLEILKQKKEEGAISADIAFVAKSLEEFQRKYKTVGNARLFVNSCKPHLDSIASQLGATNDLYIKISTAVANNALGMLISVINEAQSNQLSIIDGTLKSKIDDALSVMSIISGLAMTAQERRRFNDNKATLSNIRDQVTTITRKMNEKNNSNGCYIATMVYGDYDHPQVLVLRDFRDSVLRKSMLGRAFIRFYYRYSPTWVKHLKGHKKFNAVIRSILDKFIKVYKHEKN